MMSDAPERPVNSNSQLKNTLRAMTEGSADRSRKKRENICFHITAEVMVVLTKTDLEKFCKKCSSENCIARVE
ncbi:MAG: hypothetical protein ACFFD4_26855 [Candidatus Odinarchaeota archaeon]